MGMLLCGRKEIEMKQEKIKMLAAFLALVLGMGTLATACGKRNEENNSTEVIQTEESGVSDTDDSGSGEGTETESEDMTAAPLPELKIPNGDIITHAASLQDGGDAHYADSIRSAAVIENQNMTLVHGLNGGAGSSNVKNLVTSITNKKGRAYIEDTMDAFVRTKDGKTYYASDWMTGSSMNIYRGGYYYQEVRVTDQGFGDSEAILKDAYEVDLGKFAALNEQVTSNGVNDGVYSFTVNALSDPAVENKKLSFSTKDYNALLLTVKTEQEYFGQIYVRLKGMGGYTNEMSKYFSLIPGDDYHTYIIRLDDLKSYDGTVSAIRLDMGRFIGEEIEIKSLKAINIDENTLPVRFDRGLHAYSDKLHGELHFVTTGETENWASYGMETAIAKETVAKLILKDKKGTHDSLSGVDFDSLEYVGFDIKGAGIFGYILAAEERSGKLTVEEKDGCYVIIQEMAPEKDKVAAKSHFYMGQRIYTDESHDFDAFLKEAEIERHPLADENFSVRYDRNDPSLYSSYVGYDALRGAYRLKINYTDFNAAYFNKQNQHYRAYTTVKGDALDREIYLYTAAEGGQLESAVILDEKDMMLPIPLQVIKNFEGDGEESIYLRDIGYSETYLPLLVEAGSSRTFSILNLYQNWGKFPLMQISWIQYSAPYYHLSTGVTETNCIAPMYGGNGSFQFVSDLKNGKVYEFHVVSSKSLYTLPDFRAMSQPMWENQPQHYSAAQISWLQYTDAKGNYSASEFISDRIDAYGPVYADIIIQYRSDDGRIDATYRHAEMPQTDENRTYYTLRYEIKEDISIKNFAEDFNILEINGRSVTYAKLGYLDADNQPQIVDANKSAEGRFHILGTEAPYFDIFGYPSQYGLCNYAVLIKSANIVLDGKAFDGNFIIEEWCEDHMNYTRLSLDLGEIILKKGDHIEIDLLLLPWGDYNDKNDDKVRAVREDSCLKPYQVDVQVGSPMEDGFIPSVLAENNKAEFTLSGGKNNCAVRVYGFDVLSAPAVYEKIDGKWVEYDLSSHNTPDKEGNAHYYDGYSVQYDRDGSFSYSFAVDMKDGKARSFKVEVSAFEDYPELETGEENGEPETEDRVELEEETKPQGKGAPVHYYSAQDIYLTADKALEGAISSARLIGADLAYGEDGVRYARLYGEAGSPEAFIVFESHVDALKSAPFLAFKYRTVTPGSYHESWLNSTSPLPKRSVKEGYKTDGQWHYYVVDATVAISEGVYDGKQLCYFRFDFLNVDQNIPVDAYVDLAYIGFFASEADAMKFEYGDAYKTAEELRDEKNAACVDPSSPYKLSDTVYGSIIDFVNGEKQDASANSKEGVYLVDFVGKAAADRVTLAGWTVVDGGVEKYVWSADGGKTWQDAELWLIGSIGSGAGTAHYNVVQKKIGAYSFSASSNLNSTYQHNGGGGLMANLSAYTGQTVNVVFAAVPKNAPDTICLITCVQHVKVK